MRRGALSLLIGLVAAIGLWWALPPGDQMWRRAIALPGQLWLLAALGLMTSFAMRALRMRDEWAQRLGLRWIDGLQLTLVHSAAINLLPMRAGEAGYPWLLNRRWRVPLADAAASLLWLRVQDVVVLGGLAWVCFGPGAGELLLGLRLGGAVLLVATLALLGSRLALALLDRLPAAGNWPRLVAFARALLGSAVRAPVRGWLWSCLHWSAKIAAAAVLVAGLCDLSFSHSFFGAVGGEVAGALPLSAPAGFGTYELGVWLGVDRAGHALEAAPVFGAALTAHLFMLALTVFAAVASPWLQPHTAPVQESLP